MEPEIFVSIVSKKSIGSKNQSSCFSIVFFAWELNHDWIHGFSFSGTQLKFYTYMSVLKC